MTGQAKLAQEPGRVLPGVQSLRAIAALMVVVHHTLEESLGATHAWRSPDWLTTAGAAGVDIFFVISGFIMVYVSFANVRTPPTPAQFLSKRIQRIYPLYWLCVLAILLLKLAGFYAALQPGPRDIVLSLLLAPSDQKILGVAWTLVFEMWFYVVFAIALMSGAVLRVIIISIGAILLVMLAANAPVAEIAPAFLRRFFGDPIMLEFCFGMLLGYAYIRWPSLFAWLRWAWAPAFAILLAAPLFVAHPSTNGIYGLPRVAAWGLPAVLVLASVLPLRGGASPWARTWLELGNASYAIYLVHPFAMMLYAKMLVASPAIAAMPQIGFIAGIVVFSAVLGVLAHRTLERPLTTFVRRLLSPRRKAVAGAD